MRQIRGATGDPVMSHVAEDRQKRSRVCDQCIRRKVRCDLGKPKCSRCIEREISCDYSSVRRKPGPAPGSKRIRLSRHGEDATASADSPQHRLEQHTSDPLSPYRDNSFTTATPAFASSTSGEAFNLAAISKNESAIEPLNFTTEERDSLLEWYFNNIHHAIPLFVVDGGLYIEQPCRAITGCSHELTETISVISANLSRAQLSNITDEELRQQIDKLLGASYLREDIAGNAESLDHFRQSCILAFYEYHQCPGQQAWMRVGKLVRSAYWIGLDRVEMMHEMSPSWRDMSQDQLEEWRLVWWCIFCLDSYANVSTGMPYGIDERLVNTALPRGNNSSRPQLKALPYEPDGLVDLVRDLVTESSASVCHLALCMISITVLRSIGRATQFHTGVPREKVCAYMGDTERRLHTLRLSLPATFFNPRRNSLANESPMSQHFRLVTMHHLFMAQMLLSIGYCRKLEEGSEWLNSWQQVLELCEDVAALAKQWNASFCLSVDPALTIIAFMSLVFLDLQLKFAVARTDDDPGSSALQTNIKHCQTILLAFLEKFAESWTLPRLLILSFRGFKEALPASLSYRHIQVALRRFESPLHPRWLTFLQHASQVLQEVT